EELGLRLREGDVDLLLRRDAQLRELELLRDRIETVVKPELEAREKHGKVAQEFELAKLRIAAEKEVHVALAEAQAKLFTKMEANLYGTPEDVTKILESLTRGQSLAKGIEGFVESAGGQTLAGLGSLAKAVGKRLEGPSSENEEKALPADTSDEPPAAA
ncbi:MAG: hypothetical protein AAGH15_24655, partial [Myxococcota bacterium]